MIVRLPKRGSKQMQQLARDYTAISPWASSLLSTPEQTERRP